MSRRPLPRAASRLTVLAGGMKLTRHSGRFARRPPASAGRNGRLVACRTSLPRKRQYGRCRAAVRSARAIVWPRWRPGCATAPDREKAGGPCVSSQMEHRRPLTRLDEVASEPAKLRPAPAGLAGEVPDHQGDGEPPHGSCPARRLPCAGADIGQAKRSAPWPIAPHRVVAADHVDRLLRPLPSAGDGWLPLERLRWSVPASSGLPLFGASGLRVGPASGRPPRRRHGTVRRRSRKSPAA